jgi:DNA-binding beta-propeller fold protein YncE
MSVLNLTMTIDGEEIVLLVGNWSKQTRVDVRSRNGDVLRSFELTGAGLVGKPSGVAVDGAGNFVVADIQKNRIVVFDAAGGFVRAFDGSGSDAGELRAPSGVAVDGAGSVYVADQRNHRVVVFDAAGRVLRTLGSQGAGAGELNHPKGVAVDGAGSVYVADWGNDRVVVFDGAGRVLRTLGGGDGEMEQRMAHPRGVAVDGAGSVYVVDNLKDSIFVFKASSGDFVGTLWPGGVLGTGVQVKPTGVAVDGAGNVFALSHDDLSFTDSLVVFDQPMRSLEEHVRRRALALFMSLHHRLGAAAFELKEEVLELIWNAVPRSTDDLSDVAPGRRIMHYISY